MEFEWDEPKNYSNKGKHGIDFEKAKEIFSDTNLVTFISDEKKYGEKRFLSVGKIVNLVYTVVYTLRNSNIRIISARRSNKFERNYYQTKNK